MINTRVAVWLLAWAATALAGDQQREQDYAAAIQTELTDGKIVWLEAEKQKFLAIDTESEAKQPLGAVLLLHDMGDHPDQKPLIHALRTNLPQHRWQTLALQMPLRETSASQQDYYPLLGEAASRVQAALAYLQQNGIKNIVIIGYGLGALTALQTTSQQADKFVGLVTISLALSQANEQTLQLTAAVQKLKLPFLDIYAELDHPDVVSTARSRRLAAKDNSQYRQLKLDGDNHAYQTDADLTVKRVYSWLANLELPTP